MFDTPQKNARRMTGQNDKHGDFRRNPPFSKALIEARRRGLSPAKRGTGQVAVCLGWGRLATGGLPRLVLPDDDLPSDFAWQCLAGLVVLVQHGDLDTDRADELVDALLADGVAAVNLVNLDALRCGAAGAWKEVHHG